MHGSVAVFLLLLVHWGIQAPVGPGEPTPANDEPANKKRKIDTSSKCELKISEVKPGCTSNNDDCSPFIELQSDCKKRPGPPPKNAISNYKLVVIQANPLSLALVVDFESFVFDGKKRHIVIGAPNVPELDISLSSPHVQTIFSTTEPSLMLPSANELTTFAIMVLKDLSKPESKALHLPTSPNGQPHPRTLSTDQLNMIGRRSVDMLVIGQENQIAEYQYSYLWKLKSTNTMFLPSWEEILHMSSQSSISMCGELYDGYNADAFKVKSETPGNTNNCFQLELTDNEDQNNYDCTAESMSQSKLLHDVSEIQLQEIRDKLFQDSRIVTCQQHFPKRENILLSSSVQEWIEFKNPPDECRFTCSACRTYLSHGFRPDVKSRAYIITSGFLSKDIYDNSDAIKTHQLGELHVEAIEYYKRMKATRSIDDAKAVISEFEQKERQLFNATMNVLSMVYAEVKTGASFHSHPIFMETMQKVGLNVGRLHHTESGAQLMTTTIAKSFHFKLLSQLVKNQQPFSIMVDASTSYNQPFLAVYILTLENGYPVTHFYALIHMEEGEKAKEMSQSFINQVESDTKIVPGFVEFFKSKITSFVSDGAAVMIGVNNSFKVYLTKYVKRKIPNIVCLAHKLDSAYKTGIKAKKDAINQIKATTPVDQIKIWQLTYFEGFEKSVNEFYTFYASRGYKRWLHLLSTAEELDISPKRLKYIYNIRWSESHYRSLETLIHNYYAMVEDSKRLMDNEDNDYTTQNTASELYLRLTDKTFMIVIHDFLDILTTFKDASTMFQESSSIVIGKAKVVYDTIKSLEEYKLTGGTWMKDFLKNIICSQSSKTLTLRCDEGDCTLGYYELCDEVTLNQVKIKRNHPVSITYEQVRKLLYDNLITSVQSYFDLQLLDSFEVFNPERINFFFDKNEPISLEGLYTVDVTYVRYQPFQSYEDRLAYICSFYGLEPACDQLRIDWPILMKCLITNDYVTLHKSNDPSRFWPMAFTQCLNQWTPITLKAVSAALVTAYSSAECERGFSVMNLIKTKGRSRLDKDTLEATMRVRINGPSVEEFNAYEYSVEFLKAHRRVDDEIHKGGRRPADENFCNAMKKSVFY